MRLRWVSLSLTALLFVAGPISAEEDKPLGPGWLSLDSSVGVVDGAIANGKSALEKAIGISVGGFFDTSYQWSSNHPKNLPNISGRYFDKDHNKIVFNDFHLVIDKPEKDWGVGFHISGDFGRAGELLREATFWSRSLHKEPSAELREAYLTTTIPLGEGIGIKGGLFVTPLGTEILPNPGAFNDNITRSFLFNFAIPLRHLGVLFSYPVHKMVGLSAGIVTGWDQPFDLNGSPSFLGGFTVTPNDKVSLATNIIAGTEPTFTGAKPKKSTARWTIANVLTIKPIDPLALSVEYTFGHQNKASLGGTRDSTWQGVAGIANYSWTDRFNTALRAEYFNDRDGSRFFGDFFGTQANVRMAEFTLTSGYKFTKMLLGRFEVRQDLANARVFRKGDTTADKNQTTLALQATYSF